VLDKNKDQKIEVRELKYFMRKVAHIKLSSEEAEAMIKFADSTGQGFVTLEDFKRVVNMAPISQEQNDGAASADASEESDSDKEY